MRRAGVSAGDAARDLWLAGYRVLSGEKLHPSCYARAIRTVGAAAAAGIWPPDPHDVTRVANLLCRFAHGSCPWAHVSAQARSALVFVDEGRLGLEHVLGPLMLLEAWRSKVEEPVMTREDVCPICLEAGRSEKPLLMLPCGHVVHFACIWAAVQLCTGPKACPVCRSDMLRELHVAIVGAASLMHGI